MRVKHFMTMGVALLAFGTAPAALAAGGGTALAPTPTKHTVKHKKKKAKKPGSGFSSADTSPGGTGANGAGAGTGGAGVGTTTAPSTPSTPQHPTVPGDVAKVVKGLAYAPADAPSQVKKAIWAGDAIRHKPYVWGGGHGSWNDVGYDCSGSVSYVLHAAGLTTVSMDSSDFESWGESGLGQWITVYTNPGHAFVQIAGIRLDTSAEQDPDAPSGSGPRWRPLMTSTAGFQARHPVGF